MLLRKARTKDVNSIVQMVNIYAKNDEMLPVSTQQVYTRLRDFVIAEAGNNLIGCGNLRIYWEDLAEIRSLAVAQGYTGNGVGRKIVESLLTEARDLGITTVFTLTLKPAFFEKLGFTRVDKNEMPQKVWSDCINCTKFPACDEIALRIKL